MKNKLSGKDIGSLVQQYLYERTTWGRSLDCMQEENIHSKNRVSDILKNDIDRSLLEMMELYLNKFILEDSKIFILRGYLSEANSSITAKQKDSARGESIDRIVITQNKLKKEIELIEKEFYILKSEFNKCLSTHFETKN